MAVTLCVVMNLAEGLVSMPVLKESKGPVWKYFNFELDESGRPVDRVVCLPAPDGPKWAQTGQDGPRRAQTVPTGPRGAPDTRSWCGLMNIDILYRYAYSISCKIWIELLLPIYMTMEYPWKLNKSITMGLSAENHTWHICAYTAVKQLRMWDVLHSISVTHYYLIYFCNAEGTD